MPRMSRTLTEKCAPTYSTSSDPRVDFFFKVIEDAQKEQTIDLLSKSWNCDSLDTLKLIAFLRDCRNGKGIRRQYHMCLHWLFHNHYKTLSANVDQLVAFGYWKDLLHLLMVLLFDGLIPDYMAKDDGKSAPRGRRSDRTKKSFPIYDRLILRSDRKERPKKTKHCEEVGNTMTAIESAVESIDIEMEESAEEGPIQTVLTRAETFQQIRRLFAQKLYDSDLKYRKLYDKIVDLFANQLKSDLEKMSKNVKSISLAGKWAPTNGHHFDKYLGISEAIGKQLCRLMAEEDIANDPKAVAEFYQKRVCSPLRNYLKIPEVYMSSKLWAQIDYNRVAAKCMQKNKSTFIKYDKERFEEFLASKKTISGAVLKPVELVERGMKLLDMRLQYIVDYEEGEEGVHPVQNVNIETDVLEKQWLSLTEDILKKGGGLLDNAIAVCDVSGSMNGTPMSAAIGLTILVMSLSKEPWNSLSITFSEHPELHVVDPNKKFLGKLESLRGMAWGGTTNFSAVFKLILDKAVEQRLTNEQIPKVLLVFTDMEFDSAFPGTTLTNFEAAKQLFENSGYTLPPIVFWNLRADTSSTSTPVQTNELGTVLLSGYSGQQLSLIMKTDDLSKISPYSMMRSAIDNKRYANLKVID